MPSTKGVAKEELIESNGVCGECSGRHAWWAITKGNKKLKSPLEILQNFVEALKSVVLSIYIYIYIYKQRFFGVKILSE